MFCPTQTFTYLQADRSAASTPASGSVSTSQGSTQQNSPVTDSSLPCGKCTPQGTSTTSSQQSHKGTSNHFLSTPNSNITSPQKTAAHGQKFAMPSHNTPQQNVHHSNLLHMHLNHFSSLLLHTHNSSHCFNHQLLPHRLHTCSNASHHSCNPGLVLKANILGNKGTHFPLCKILILLCSLSFQQQRHNRTQCPTARNLESQS